MQAAPNPLSIFTTETLGEQVFNIPSSAATPPNDAPYPTLVGTASTGAFTRPATTVGSAPSIPAQTINTRADCRDCFCASRRWIPATPTSAINSVVLPIRRVVTAASSATGKSLVPAQTTAIVPLPGSAAVWLESNRPCRRVVLRSRLHVRSPLRTSPA